MPSAILNLKFKVCNFCANTGALSWHAEPQRPGGIVSCRQTCSCFVRLVQGNKSFVAFSNLGDTESLTKTWKVRTL